jgi:hypothetical protein
MLKALLDFKPWMLALAVFLACAIGIGLMERLRDHDVWAQAAAPAPADARP